MYINSFLEYIYIYNYEDVDPGNGCLRDDSVIYLAAGMVRHQDNKKHFLGEELEVLSDDKSLTKPKKRARQLKIKQIFKLTYCYTHQVRPLT